MRTISWPNNGGKLNTNRIATGITQDQDSLARSQSANGLTQRSKSDLKTSKRMTSTRTSIRRGMILRLGVSEPTSQAQGQLELVHEEKEEE